MFDVVPHADVPWARCDAASVERAGSSSVVTYDIDCEPLVEQMSLPAVPHQMLVTVSSGSAQVESRSGRGWAAAQFHPGVTSLTAGGRPVELRWRGAERLQCSVVYLSQRLIDDTARELWGHESGLMHQPDSLAMIDPAVTAVVRALREARRHGQDGLYVDAAATFLAVHLLSHHVRPPQSSRPTPEPRRFAAVIDFIHDHQHRSLTLAELAGVAGLSPYHFLRSFKASVGLTPHQYLTALRLDRARRLLEQTDLTVTEIAEQCGFASSSRLAASFRQAVGNSPVSYRLATRGRAALR